jgi:ABC-type Zn2+ transport system substrate-binding protein/surface adhesin
MRKHPWKPILLTLSALAMTGLSTALVSAQDRHDEHRPDDHHAMRADEHRDDHGRDDQVQRYRHDHPHSSARCHDGFFTSTKDRNRACSKHGGIDIWLSL